MSVALRPTKREEKEEEEEVQRQATEEEGVREESVLREGVRERESESLRKAGERRKEGNVAKLKSSLKRLL